MGDAIPPPLPALATELDAAAPPVAGCATAEGRAGAAPEAAAGLAAAEAGAVLLLDPPRCAAAATVAGGTRAFGDGTWPRGAAAAAAVPGGGTGAFGGGAWPRGGGDAAFGGGAAAGLGTAFPAAVPAEVAEALAETPSAGLAFVRTRFLAGCSAAMSAGRVPRETITLRYDNAEVR